MTDDLHISPCMALKIGTLTSLSPHVLACQMGARILRVVRRSCRERGHNANWPSRDAADCVRIGWAGMPRTLQPCVTRLPKSARIRHRACAPACRAATAAIDQHAGLQLQSASRYSCSSAPRLGIRGVVRIAGSKNRPASASLTTPPSPCSLRNNAPTTHHPSSSKLALPAPPLHQSTAHQHRHSTCPTPVRRTHTWSSFLRHPPFTSHQGNNGFRRRVVAAPHHQPRLRLHIPAAYDL